MSSLASILNITKSIPLMPRISDRASDMYKFLSSEKKRNGRTGPVVLRSHWDAIIVELIVII